LKKFMVLSAAALAMAGANAQAVMYTGSLSTAGGGIVAGGSWPGTAGVTLSWVVQDVGPNWQYSYTFSSPVPNMSHIIFELSAGVTSLVTNPPADLYTTSTPGDFGPGPSNPGMPGTMYGVKFDVVSGSNPFTVTFVSDRSPVWGDFYAKGGASSFAYNAGFLAADPTDPPSDGSINNHILRPDTNGPPPAVPVPPTVALALVGGLTAGIGRRVRQRWSGAAA
jgi:hypothetical protein